MDATLTLLPQLTWLDGRFETDRAIRIRGGRIAEVVGAGDVASRSDAEAGEVVRLPGRAVLPGFVNVHSHAFQRLIRGRTQWRSRTTPAEDFWSWREAMYGAALSLSADEVEAVARWCFLEMMHTGITAVGEFHYLHHRPDGRPYPDPVELARRVIAAAQSVGMRLVLLNVCYATGGIGRELDDRQRRFRTASLQEYLDRTDALLEVAAAHDHVSVGIAPHSVRAVPRDWLPALHAFAEERRLPLHMHVAEQTAEVDASVAAFGLRPVELLATDGILGPRFTAVHATHLTDAEIALLAGSRSTVCACPTTERDLGDGFLRGRDLLDAGVELCLGTDSHTSLDFFEEMRLVEYHERLRRRERVVITGGEDGGPASVAPPLLRMGTTAGARALGLRSGTIRRGCTADLIAVDLAHPSILGSSPETLGAALTLSATPGVVRDVWVGGVRRVEDGAHPLRAEAAEGFRRVAAAF